MRWSAGLAMAGFHDWFFFPYYRDRAMFLQLGNDRSGNALFSGRREADPNCTGDAALGTKT